MTFVPSTVQNLDALYRRIAAEVDVGDARYEDAEKRYKAVGSWLDAPDSILKPFSPHIYVQGSFSLGTATKPFGVRAEFDVDAVCVLRTPPTFTGQQWLKEVVGKRLFQSGVYGPMVVPREGKRRCWRIQYHDGSKFHLDLCPAIPENTAALIAAGLPKHIADHSLLLTDNSNYSTWITGNAIGYRMWFMGRMQERLLEQRSRIAAAVHARVDAIPEYRARTTLQLAVKILKRHRDIRYSDDVDRPISIIITTLAAQAYDNDPRLDTALRTIVRGMRKHIRTVNDEYIVSNPVDPRENFADKWKETKRKAEIFFAWLDSVEELDETLQNVGADEEVTKILKEGFGEAEAENAIKAYRADVRQNQSFLERFLVASSPSRLPIRLPPAPHAKEPMWNASEGNDTASLTCSQHRSGFRVKTLKNGEELQKGIKLRFNVHTTAKWPYEVHWQVVNTGGEAWLKGQMRGEFYPDEFRRGGRTREETTAYTGAHWVECFIVKDWKLVARSGPFIVSIL